MKTKNTLVLLLSMAAITTTSLLPLSMPKFSMPELTGKTRTAAIITGVIAGGAVTAVAGKKLWELYRARKAADAAVNAGDSAEVTRYVRSMTRLQKILVLAGVATSVIAVAAGSYYVYNKKKGQTLDQSTVKALDFAPGTGDMKGPEHASQAALSAEFKRIQEKAKKAGSDVPQTWADVTNKDDIKSVNKVRAKYGLAKTKDMSQNMTQSGSAANVDVILDAHEKEYASKFFFPETRKKRAEKKALSEDEPTTPLTLALRARAVADGKKAAEAAEAKRLEDLEASAQESKEWAILNESQVKQHESQAKQHRSTAAKLAAEAKKLKSAPKAAAVA